MKNAVCSANVIFVHLVRQQTWTLCRYSRVLDHSSVSQGYWTIAQLGQSVRLAVHCILDKQLKTLTVICKLVDKAVLDRHRNV